MWLGTLKRKLQSEVLEEGELDVNPVGGCLNQVESSNPLNLGVLTREFCPNLSEKFLEEGFHHLELVGGVDGVTGSPSVVLKGDLQMASSSDLVLSEASLQMVVRKVEGDKDEIGSPVPLCTIPPKLTSILASDSF